MAATYGGIPMSTLYPAERNSTDVDLARVAVDDLRRAEAMFAEAWRVAQAAISRVVGTEYDWTGDAENAAYSTMQTADDACREYADAVEANIGGAA